MRSPPSLVGSAPYCNFHKSFIHIYKKFKIETLSVRLHDTALHLFHTQNFSVESICIAPTSVTPIVVAQEASCFSSNFLSDDQFEGTNKA